MSNAVDLQLRARLPSSSDPGEARGYSATPSGDPNSSGALGQTLRSILMWAGIPTVAVAIYLFGFAADQYVAKAQFVVRGATNPVGGQYTGNLTSIIALNTNQDTFIAADLISLGAMRDEINAKRDLRAMFSKPASDFWAGLRNDATDDELADYWTQMVFAHVEPITGAVVVETHAFSPEDAAFLTNEVIKAAENRLNELHGSYLRQSVALADEQVDLARSRLANIRSEIRKFREAHNVLDTATDATSVFREITDLRRQRIETRAALAVARAQKSADSPGARLLERRLAALDQQIAKVEQELTGRAAGDVNTVSAAMETYDALSMHESMASQFYLRSVSAQTQARLRIDRRDIYLDVFVPSEDPQESRFPNRWTDLALALAIFVGLWTLGRLLYASTMDHEA